MPTGTPASGARRACVLSARRNWRSTGRLSAGLSSMPAPQPPADLVSRTHGAGCRRGRPPAGRGVRRRGRGVCVRLRTSGGADAAHRGERRCRAGVAGVGLDFLRSGRSVRPGTGFAPPSWKGALYDTRRFPQESDTDRWLDHRRCHLSLRFLICNIIFVRERHAPLPVRIIIPVLFPALLAGYALLIAYVYGDARRRGMRYVMWTLLAIFLFNGIGIILYFILREPLMVYCSRCGGGRTTQSRILSALRRRRAALLPGMPPYHPARLDSLRLVRKSVVRHRTLWGTIPSTP